MHPRWNSLLVGFILILLLSVSTAARTYTSYYTCLPGSVTAVVVTNASSFEHEQAFNLTLYDAAGSLVHTFISALKSYESAVYFLNDYFKDPDEFSWGSFVIESNVLLLAGVWIGTETEWVSISNVQAQTLSSEGLDIAYYWYGANYANTESRRTGIAVVNPGESVITGTTFIYDSAGSLQNHSDFTLTPHGSAFFKPESVFPVGEDSWGLIDIRSTSPIVVASEYYDANGVLLDVDIVNTVYYLQVQQEESGDS
ncbi:hypothetical protein KAR02_06060 [Candidatus Bipolaricaulota bacterium]|nr:hypothetical protein [Candidatus Bipolaricaulota bacterium]